METSHIQTKKNEEEGHQTKAVKKNKNNEIDAQKGKKIWKLVIGMAMVENKQNGRRSGRSNLRTMRQHGLVG